MTKKKGPSNKSETSVTQTDFSLTGSDSVELEELLGANKLEEPKEICALLRLNRLRLTDDLRKRLGVKLEAEALNAIGPQPLILGPIPQDLLHSLACAGSLGSRDQILLSNNRWKELVDVYPDLKGLILERDDLTHTATQTLTEAKPDENPDEQTFTGSFNEVEGLEIEKESVSTNLKLRETTRPSIPATNRNIARADKRVVTTQAQSTRSYLLWGFPVTIAAVLLMLFLWSQNPNIEVQDNGHMESQARREKDEARLARLPDNLKPKNISTLDESLGVLQRKLRPFFYKYEKGSFHIDAGSLRVIESVASPAAASFEARIEATNFLSVLSMGKGNFDEARNFLKPILIAAPTDLTSLMNSAILEVMSGNYASARTFALSAQRLCASSECWLANALLGVVESHLGRYEQAQLLFEGALASNSNILLYGLWLSTFDAQRRLQTAKIEKLLLRALWTDPDRLLDTPPRAPLALHWFYGQALEGLQFAVNASSKGVSYAQKKYVQWLMGLNPFLPSSESRENVARELSKEDEPLSQVLYAYLLKEMRKYEDASRVLARTIQLVDFDQIRSSWPWTLAGNIFEERSVSDQAIFYYQNALSRNPRDINAMYGLAIALREKDDFQGALEKIGEVLRLDPKYAPALLRLRRYEWHKIWKVQD